MAAVITTLARSAAPESSKVATAVAKVLKRWKNSSTDLSKKEFEEVSLDYSDDLSAMGFNFKWRANIFRSAVTGYAKIAKSDNRNRPGASSKMKRRKKKLVGDVDWFRSPEEQHQGGPSDQSRHPRRRRSGVKEPGSTGVGVTEDIMFIPHTPNSMLKKELTKWSLH